MKNFKIVPLRGVNDIEFGFHAEKVRSMIGGNFQQFRRGDEVFPSDHSNEQGVFCYYDDSGALEAMEFHEPARVFLGEINILSLHYNQALPLISRIDQNVRTDGDGAIFKNVSIGLYAPGADEEDDEYEPIEAVLVGRPGYYDFIDD